MSIKLKRKAYDKLLEWKRDSNGSTALLINGARRIGKSYLVNEFGQNEYKSYLCIDFSRRDMNVIGFFENDSYDLDIFFEKLSAYYGVTLFPKESLIIFDEVQAYPFARQLVKHLVADGRYHYIETGSLLSIRANVQDIVIPSEEVDFFLHPLDFEEFLWALGDHTSYPYIQT